MGAGHPVIQRNRYALETVEIERAVLIGLQEVLLTPSTLIARNLSNSAEEIVITERIHEVAELWERVDEFPADIADLLRQHQSRCASGSPLTAPDEELVYRLQTVVGERSGDLGVIYSETGDAVPVLLGALKLQRPEPLLRIEDIDPEDIQLKRRAIKEWKRWANARGPSSAKFRQQVRSAYRSTCLFCGATFPETKITMAGVDAAHILPWSEYDLDSVRNGLCLCKQHHWAFDEAILRMSFTSGKYVVTVDTRVAEDVTHETPQFSLEELVRYEGVIATERLPANPQQWPAPELLQILANWEHQPSH